ncbi:MAG: Sec-independent protein translocase protein TatB [Rubricella sp.]
MFDIGFYELLVVGVVALIVVGPKDLPRMFHTVGKLVGQAKGMARQFQSAMNDAAREADLDQVRDVANTVRKAADPLNSATSAARDYANSLKEDMMRPEPQAKPDPAAPEEGETPRKASGADG